MWQNSVIIKHKLAKMKEICCIGHITRDRIITCRPPRTVHCAGGTAYYVAWAMQALPHDVDFQVITSVSLDVMPEVEKLRQADIDVVAYQSKTNVFFENAYGENMDNRKQRVLAKSEPFTIEQLSFSFRYAAGRRFRTRSCGISGHQGRYQY